MPTTGGVYSLPPGTIVTAGETILPSQHNPAMEDIAQGLTDRLMRDGSAGMSGDLPMGNNQITGLGAATAGSHAIRYDQAAKGAYLLSVSALSLAANEMVYASGANVAAKTALTPYARTLLDDADAGTARATLGAVAEGRTISAGDGLSGGGDLTANRAFAVDGTVVRTTRQIIAGNGLIGGGNLGADRTLAIGAPSSISATSGNSATGGTHSHELATGTARTQLADEAQAGTVGTYATIRLNPGGVATPNQNVPSSAMSGFASTSGDVVGGTPLGTWKCMGNAGGGSNADRTTLFLRVS